MSLRYNIKNNIDTKTHIYFKPTENNNLDDIKVLIEDDKKLHIHQNDEYVNKYNNYTNVKDYIIGIINKTGFFCKGLNSDYISDSFDNVDAVVIIGSLMDILPNGNIFGFALIKFDQKHNSIYIDVICSHIGIKGAGDILIKEIEYISEKLLMTEIYLNSVDTAISFYERYGFTKYDKSCDDMCLMIKSIKKKNGGKKRKTKKQRKSIKIKKTKKMGVLNEKRCKRKGQENGKQ
jgi:predicted GNAT family N-acyltransferase